MKPTVYVETSVISYFTARMSRDLIVAAHQQITQEWWDDVLPETECFISPFVLDEISRGDEEAAKKRLNVVITFSVLEVNEEIQMLADQYFEILEISGKARVDTFHLATASWHEMDYLLSWNCKHIASGRVKRIVGQINSQLSVKTPVICTPEELMEL
jgi:predicted nucleic acid-binding protein